MQKIPEEETEGKDVPCPFCKGKNPDCDKCSGKGKLKFRMASNEECEHFETYVDMVLSAIEQVFGIGGALVTDMSSVGDFLHGPDSKDAIRIVDLSAALGFQVSPEDRIVGVAKRLKKHIEDCGGIDQWQSSF